MESTPDVLVVTAWHEEQLSSDRAEVLVTVEGSSLVTGRAALRQAKEVARLVEELAHAGVTEADIGLEGVQAEVTSGLLGKSSSATYRLRVRCGNLEMLPDVLGAVTGAKNARLQSVVWHYPESADRQARWLQAAIASANVKAQAAAAALGARLAGVHRLTEHPLDEPNTPMLTSAYGAVAPGARPRGGPLSLGFELGSQKRAGVRVEIEYRVEGFAPPAPGASAPE
jgi:uncharacterized protein YggE